MTVISHNKHAFPTVQTFNSCTSRPDICQCLVVQTPIDIMSNKKSNTLITHIACESKLRSVVRSYMHPCPGNWVAIGCAVVYSARAAHAFSAGIKCWHCSYGFIGYVPPHQWDSMYLTKYGGAPSTSHLLIRLPQLLSIWSILVMEGLIPLSK